MKEIKLKGKNRIDMTRGCFVEYTGGIKYFSTVRQAIRFIESNCISNLDPYIITDAITHRDISFILNKNEVK